MKQFHIQRKYFDSILSGEKKYEGRAIDSRMVSTVSRDETIEIWTNNEGEDSKDYSTMKDSFYAKVIDKFDYFIDIENMLYALGYKNMIPDAKNMNDAIQVYKNLRLASGKSEDGPMAAIQLQVIKLSNEPVIERALRK
jgi:ASC-1-like (ASCH) protein